MLQSVKQAHQLTTDQHIRADVKLMSDQMKKLKKLHKPDNLKVLRKFLITEVSKLTSIPTSTLRTLSLEGEGPEPERLENNHRIYTLEQINEIRAHMATQRPSEAVKFNPRRREHDHLQVITCTNFKGGSAKTTTSVHLAQYLALQGLRVLAIDLDPQASMSAMFGVISEFDVSEDESFYACVRSDRENARPLSDVIRRTYFTGLDLVPANLQLNMFEQETPRDMAQGTMSKDRAFWLVLGNHLETVADNYDVVVIDTPPSLGFLSLAAIYASTSLIVTVHPAMLDVQSMSQFLLMMADVIEDVERMTQAPLQHDFYRYLITRHDPNDHPQKMVEAMLRHHFGDRVIGPTAVQSAAIETSSVGNQTLYELESSAIGRETYKRARESMDDVNKAIFDLILGAWGRK